MADPFTEKVQALVIDNVGSRVVGINETTRQGIASVIEKALGTEGEALTSSDIASQIKDIGAFNEARAELIARTEMAFAFNTAALTSYNEYGVAQVQAIDGDHDPECAERNGKTFSVDEAMSIEDHPNGTLDWIPVTGVSSAAPAEAAPVEAPTVPVPTSDLTPLDKSVNAFERQIIAKAPKVEYGQIFDANGVPMTEITKGGTSRITWRIPSNAWRDGHLTHFHPDAAGRVTGHVVSLSDVDVMTAIDTRLASIRAFGIDGRWMEFRNLGYEYNSLAFKTAFKSAWSAARRGQWWAQPIKDSAKFAEASEKWNAAYRQTLIDTVEKVGRGRFEIVEGKS